MDIIRVENLKLHYSLEAGIKKAIDDITLEIKKGFTVITGPSGSGKSSFIQMIGGLKKPTGGSIRACLKNKNCTKRMFYFPFS